MKFFLITILFLIYTNTLTAQQQQTTIIDSVDNIYIQLSTTIFNPGDTIFFKANVLNSKTFISKSNILYLGIANNEGKIIEQYNFPISYGNTNGLFVLPKLLTNQCYYIYAATAAMLAQKNCYSQKINFNNSIAVADTNLINYTVQLNSNKLIHSVPNIFFVKANYSSGNAAIKKLYIANNENKIVAAFNTNKNGLAMVSFLPNKNYSYKMLDDKNAIVHNFIMADTAQTGFCINANFEDNVLTFRAYKNKRIPILDDAFTITATYNNQTIYEKQVSFDKYFSVNGGLRLNNINDGIVYFTLYDKQKNIVANTAIAIAKNDVDAITVDSIKVEETKANIVLKFIDSTQKLLSIAVVKNTPITTFITNYNFNIIQTVNTQKNENYADEILIANNINFNTNSEDNEVIKTLINDNYLINITGTVYEQRTAAKLSGGKLNIFQINTDSTALGFEVKVNKNGDFVIGSLLFMNNANFYYKYETDNGKPKQIVLQLKPNKTQFLVDSLIKRILVDKNLICNEEEKFNISKTVATKSIIKEDSKYKNLDIVEVKTTRETKREQINNRYTAGVFTMQSRIFIDNINEPTANKSIDGLNYVMNRVNYLVLQTNDGQKNFGNRKNFSLQPRTGAGFYFEVGLTIDEFPASILQLQLLRADEIALVKFFDAGWVGASSAYPGGLVAVYTKKITDKLPKENPTQNMPKFSYEGFSNYNTQFNNEKNSSTPLNNTLFWLPNIYLSSNDNKYSFTVNNTIKGDEYKIIIDGISTKQEIIHIEKIVTIK